jgi:hypothetical protein
MWFRTINGNLIEINRNDYLSCKDYNISIMETILNKKQPDTENVLEYVLNIIKNK